MKKSNMKSINKQTKSMLITYAMVIAVFIIVEIMISTGMMSSLMQGLLVPLCIYSIVAIGLNLCVGYLGELSLGHASRYVCWCILQCGIFQMHDDFRNERDTSFYFSTSYWYRCCSGIWMVNRYSGSSPSR